ncbi:LysR family transcriptional regulator [Azorhizobium oxalatiphilum]|uniref:LysR family transcriptional regulator n=1 Tax=Azorhizobium oxalatiphilum TaxID=980631 RepID=A0A917BK06_9HYPH|nr:LysR family transcriptional regulator [Azorhizobium oxalatiphilum]GGF47085.1 LysR family transcriptional regulator [Azorhizobium oxalatiphilum]
MNWDHARVFLAVAREGQMLAAARKLGLDHATVTRRLNALEDDLGAKVFERSPAGCVLTTAGETLLGIAERVEGEMVKAQSLLGNADLRLSGTVRIGAPDGFGTYFLAARLGELAVRHPDLVIQLVPLPQTFSLSKREADIAVVLDRPRTGRLIGRKLTNYSLSLYAARSHLERHGPIVGEADLSDRLAVTYVQDLTYSTGLDYMEALTGLTARRFECASVVGQMEAVRAGAGVGILHDYAAAAYPELVPVLPHMRFERSYWLAMHADMRGLRRISEVEQFIVAGVQAERRTFVVQRAVAATAG